MGDNLTKRNHILSFLWRAAYPVAIHFLVGQVVAHIFLTVILWIGGSSKDYIAAAMTVTGIADLLVIFILLPLYFNDSCQRKAKGIIPLFTRYFPSVKDCVLLRWSKVNLNINRIWVKQFKTGKEVTLPIAPELREV